MENIQEELSELTYKVLFISGHIKIATDMLNNIYEPHKKIDESMFLSCIDLLEEKSRQLNDIYKAMDKLNLKLGEINL